MSTQTAQGWTLDQITEAAARRRKAARQIEAFGSYEDRLDAEIHNAEYGTISATHASDWEALA